MTQIIALIISVWIGCGAKAATCNGGIPDLGCQGDTNGGTH